MLYDFLIYQELLDASEIPSQHFWMQKLKYRKCLSFVDKAIPDCILKATSQ